METAVMETPVDHPAAQAAEQSLTRLLGLSAPAYRVAVHVLGSAQSAEDVVQQAYLEAVARVRSGPQLREERTWFLKVVSNIAKDHLLRERRRLRKEAAVKEFGMPAGSGPGSEMVAALGAALQGLDAKYRLPVALCLQEGLSQREAAEILDVPERTVSHHVKVGLEHLREQLARSGYAAASGVIAGALVQAAPPVPAALAGAMEKVVFSGAGVKGTGAAAAASAAAKGGIAMKVVIGVIAAGVLAGGVAVVNGLGSGVGAGLRPAPTTLSSAPAAPAADSKPAPVNDYKGTQEREEVFEFADKPKAAKEGDKTVITFTSKGKCDATVAIVDKDGKIVRHLASGVLGANAPHPFQPSSLSQKIEWDGQDDAGQPAPAGCKVRVSLGLQPKFERNIGYDPYDQATGVSDCQMPEFGKNDKYLVGKGAGGELFVLGMPKGGMDGRVYKDGKYVRTFWPPAAKDVEKLTQFKPLSPRDAYRFETTTWGTKVLRCGNYGPFVFNGDGRRLPLPDHGKAMFFMAGVNDYKLEPWPAGIQKAAADPKVQTYFSSHCLRLAADRYREEIYAGFGNFIRFDGKTGKLDSGWTPRGELRSASEAHVGPDGLLYLRVGGANYGQWVIRLDHDGKVVPFTGNGAAPMLHEKWDFSGKGMYCGDGWSPALKGQNVIALWNGMISTSNVHTRGLYVSPRGFIVCTVSSMDKAWGLKHGIPADWPTTGSYAGTDWPVFGEHRSPVVLFDKDGNVLTANAVGDTGNGHGVTMDRDGNIYAATGGRWPDGQTTYDGLVGMKREASAWGGIASLLKFRGGGPFPLGVASYGKETPAGYAKLVYGRSGLTGFKGALWIWGGLTCQTADTCTCHNTRYDMDYFARHWIPSNQFYGISVLDANGNRIARLGKYGNVDDTDEDVKEKRDGLRFAWPRAVAASDTALYVADVGSRRILKATITYAAEETVPLP